MTDMVRVTLENGAEASVPAGFAKRLELPPVTDDKGEAVSPFGKSGNLLSPTYPDEVAEAIAEASKLTGQKLNDALTAAGLSLDGKVADKQQRLGTYDAEVAEAARLQGLGGTPPEGTDGGTPPVVTE